MNNTLDSKPLLTYKVEWPIVKLKYTEEERIKIIELCKDDDTKFITIVDLLCRGERNDVIEREPWLNNLVTSIENNQKEFCDSDPINSRREAFRFANNINEVISESDHMLFDTRDVYNNIKTAGLEKILRVFPDQFNMYIVSIWFKYGILQHYIGSTFPSNTETVKAWAKEYEIYCYEGYKIGGEGPYQRFFPELQQQLEVLPDIRSLFEKQ